jgi:hypothetical protein
VKIMTEETTITEKISTSPTSLVRLVSRLKYPVHVPYDGDTLTIPPQGKAEYLDPSKIEGPLPNGIYQGNM